MSTDAYKQRLVTLRTQMEMEKVQKKKDNEQYASLHLPARKVIRR